MGLVIALIVAAIALVVIGAIVHGLFDLLLIGIGVLIVAVIFAGIRSRLRSRRVSR
jgi:hypothetical protein